MRRTLFFAGAIALALAQGAAAQEVKSVLAGADPAADYFDGQLWIDPTGHGDSLEAWSSPDRRSFTRAGRLLALKDIAWVRDDRQRRHYLWAPDMVAAAGRFYLYYSVGPQHATPSRLGVAICDTPKGPCADSGKPLLTGGNGFEAIDPMVLLDRQSGTRYLYTGGSAGAKLRVFELKPDMVTIDHEDAIAQPPLFTEGAFVHEQGGIYYLSYSHGLWNTADYSVHYATAPTPLGPWDYRGVILRSDGKYKGPGHHSFVQDPKDGSWWIVYHRWERTRGDGPYTGDRRIAIQRIAYDAYGRIVPIRMTR